MSTKPQIIFDVKDVNISDIMAQIHADMESRGYDIEEMKNLSRGLNIKTSAPTAGCENLNRFAGAVNSSNNVQYWWVIPSQGGFKGKIRVFFNKLMRKLTFFYMKHVFDQQNIFNVNVTNSINVLSDACNKITLENNDLLMRITALNNENAALNETVQKLNANIENTMSKYIAQISAIENMYASRQNQLDSVNTAMAARLHRIEKNDFPVADDTSMEASKELTVAKPSAFLADNYEKHDFDYYLFESKYRGASEEIKKRQEHYLQYFVGQENVLDLGCGRGEFLELLSENEISANGIDMLPENIRCCKEKNINAVLGDGIEYLRNCKDNSLGGIFCAQVIEHLSTEQLIELVRLAHKKLKRGANLILETLNPQCLMIYSESFYMDPSHTKPVHPYSVKFIAECEGFIENEIIYMTPSDESFRLPLDTNNEKADTSINTINHLLFGNREYALVAKK